MLQMPICAFCKQRFVDADDEADDDVPLCPACVALVVPGSDLTEHAQLRAYRDMGDDDAIQSIAMQMAGKGASALKISAYRGFATRRIADLRFCDNAVRNDEAGGVHWNVSHANGKQHGHQFPCKHFGKGKGEFSQYHLGYPCDGCGDQLAYLKAKAKPKKGS